MMMPLPRSLSPFTLAVLLGATALGGCRGGEDGAGIADAGNEGSGDDGGSADGGDGNDTGTNAESGDDGVDSGSDDGGAPFEVNLLACPEPGSLPFTTESNAFENPQAEQIATDNPRFKDQSSDILGVPGGVAAHTALPQTSSPGAGDLVFEGAKARAPNAEGLTSIGLPSEWVSLWTWDGAAWMQLARQQLSEAGNYTLTGLPATRDKFQPIYAVLEADGSCTEHFLFLMDEGTPVIVTDIDGTMTLSDEELFKQIDDGTYDPVENGSAATLMNTWADKGYAIVYLTARPHAFRAETRAWLVEHDFPVGPVISANSLVFSDSARQYKRTWVSRMTEDFGWRIAAAYGNATSDIDAYEDGAIAKDITFIIGEFAGASETQGIDNNDFTTHIADFVDSHPNAADF